MTATIDRRATRLDIYDELGDDLAITHTWNLDLTGYELSVTAGDQDFDVTVTPATVSEVTIVLTAAQKSTLGAGSHPFAYTWTDPDGLTRKVLKGSLILE